MIFQFDGWANDQQEGKFYEKKKLNPSFWVKMKINEQNKIPLELKMNKLSTPWYLLFNIMKHIIT